MAQRFQNIDQMRGLAASSVLLGHLCANAFIISRDLSPDNLANVVLHQVFNSGYVEFGRLGVLIFFLISGYLIPFSFSGDHPLRNFVISRFFRLYPLYWFSLGAALTVSYMAGNAIASYDVLANISMVPDFLGSERALDVYWTLELEFVFYILVATLYACFGALSLATARRCSASLIAMTLALSAMQTVGLPSLGADRLLLIAVMFLGATMRGTQTNVGRTVDRYVVMLSLGLLAAVVFRGYVHFEMKIYGSEFPYSNYLSHVITHILAFLIFAFAISVMKIPFADLLGRLGTISYSVYLVHPVIINMVDAMGWREPLLASSLYVPSIFVITILLSLVSYAAIEKPFMQLGKAIRFRVAPQVREGG